nr:MAG TPA: hypothetical protein [Caudoviricetes sp.]
MEGMISPAGLSKQYILYRATIVDTTTIVLI